jgi:methionyl-tRNA formyltransferase
MGTLVDCGADLGVVVAFGALIPTRILDVLPMVNVHFSSLPRWRGPAPVEWAVRSGDTTTGVCVIAVGGDFDIGGIHARIEVQIGPRETAVGLRNRLVYAGVELLVSTLAAGLEAPVPQVGEPTWAEKLTVSDRELDWGLTAVALDRLVRAGGAWTLVHGRRLKVLAAEPSADGPDGPPGLLVDDRVATGDGWLRLVEVQAQDRSRQPFATWWVGARIEAGVHLGR